MASNSRRVADSTIEQLCLPSIPGFTVRADFKGGELSSDFGTVMLSGLDRKIGLINRLTAAIQDSRDSRYTTHSVTDLLKQRVFQIASGYASGNDANTLRDDPMFKLAAGRAPLDSDNPLASGATHSRFEGSLTRKDIYRIAQALGEQYIASYSHIPDYITLDMDHTADETHGQQELSFYNHHYGCHCYLPLLVFDAGNGALVTAVLRPGKRPTGAENAMIMKRVLRLLRKHWPKTHITLRGDGHFSNPELIQLITKDGNADFLFGLPGNSLLYRKAEPLMKNSRGHLKIHRSLAEQKLGPKVQSVRMFGEFEYAAQSWSQPYRVVLKAEVLAGSNGAPDKDNERFVVTSLRNLSPQAIYEREYCDRGNAELLIKQIKSDLESDRTSASTFLSNFGRLLLTAAAYVLHQQFRQQILQETELANAQPKTVIQSLFKIAVRVKQYKDRVLLHLPTSCPVKPLLAKICQRLCKPAKNSLMLASP